MAAATDWPRGSPINAARVSFALVAGEASSFDANLDSLFFYDMGVIFEGGFESGDTSEWSATAP